MYMDNLYLGISCMTLHDFKEDDLSECECDELEGNLCHCERHYMIGELLFNGGPRVVFKDILNLTCIVGSYSIVCICCTHDFHG